MAKNRNILTFACAIGITIFSSGFVSAQRYDGYGNPYPGQERYMHRGGAAVEEYYHPRQDQEGSQRFLERLYRRQEEMKHHAQEWNAYGRVGPSPYERECDRIGCR